MTLSPGTRVDSYEIVAPLGAGGMGEVYRAHDKALRRDVAVKVIPAYWSSDPDRLRRFELEAQAAAALSHPNIVSVFHVGQFDGSPYIVTELLRGESLRDRVVRGPCRVSEVLGWGVQLARGLAAAHQAGIVHRDLKPENIFLTRDGVLKILDFGLAKLEQSKAASTDGATVTMQQQTNPGHVLGTVGYMSPEQVRGEPADARSDIFAVGVILYEMLTARRPFRKATSAETMTAILQEELPALSEAGAIVPPGMQRIVSRCLAKVPEHRFQHASDLAFALESLSDTSMSGAPVVASVAVSRKGWIWAALIALMAAVVTATVFWWKQPPAVPVVQSITQLTDTGQPKMWWPILTDGSRVYFSEGSPTSLRIGMVAVTGGRAGVLSTPFPNPAILGIAPKGSALLLRPDGYHAANGPLWLLNLPAVEPQRIGNLEAGSATITPDGRVLFSQADSLFLSEIDGSHPQKLISGVNGSIAEPSASPDGKHLVFTVDSKDSPHASIYLANADGSGVRKLVSSDPYAGVCCAAWTSDSKYVIIPVSQGQGRDLWAYQVEKPMLGKVPPPVQLTKGPLLYSGAAASADGNQLFAVGLRERGQLVRYDRSAKEFVPFLGGLSAINASFSRDGNWVAYIAFPEGTLWRSRTDGTERLQLTFPPATAGYPMMSPDGTRIAYQASTHAGIFIISANGGVPQRVTDKVTGAGDWSPDGNHLIYAEYGENYTHPKIKALDVTSGITSNIDNPEERDGPLWLGNDKIVASVGSRDLSIYDMTTHTWSAPITNPSIRSLGGWARSPDYKMLAYTTTGPDPKAMRFGVADGRTEVIADIKDFPFALSFLGSQITLAPDGSPLFTRNVGTQEIYSLSMKWP